MAYDLVKCARGHKEGPGGIFEPVKWKFNEKTSDTEQGDWNSSGTSSVEMQEEACGLTEFSVLLLCVCVHVWWWCVCVCVCGGGDRGVCSERGAKLHQGAGWR